MKTGFAIGLVAVMALGSAAALLSAQTPPAQAVGPSPMLVIFREEVKPGKGAAHTVNETGWAAMMAKASWPTGWLGTTSLTGPSEAWFFTGIESLAAYDKDRLAQDAAESLRESDKFSAQDGELLTRTSTMIGAYRPGLSYRPTVDLPRMRYLNIDTVVVKPGYGAEFAERWREIVAAHTKANLDEHWAVYEITSGGQSGTFLFIYPMESLATLDASGTKHQDSAYRDAVGESGRAKNAAMTRDAIQSEHSRLFAFNPKMSHLSKEWTEADPEFWAPKPAPAPKK